MPGQPALPGLSQEAQVQGAGVHVAATGPLVWCRGDSQEVSASS
jgi:hypothetical protein